MPVWREKYPGVEALKVAVMGCIVNGPGESKHADIGISLPGTGETPAAPVFIDGQKAATLRGPDIAADFETHGRRLYRSSASGAARPPPNSRCVRFGLAAWLFCLLAAGNLAGQGRSARQAATTQSPSAASAI